MNKEKLMENWDTLKDETKIKIFEMASEEIWNNYFCPKFGEEYYYYDYDDGEGIYLEKQQCNTKIDKLFVRIGNAFRTPEEALFAGNCDYYTKMFETYVNRHSNKLDWENVEQNKFYVWYDNYKKKIVTGYYTTAKTQGTIYASSKQILKDAINYIGEDNFLNYVLRVGE